MRLQCLPRGGTGDKHEGVSTEHDPGQTEPSSVGGDPLVTPRQEGVPPGEAEATGSELSTPAAETAGVSAETSPGYEIPPHTPSRNMLPGRERRRSKLERLVVRLIATCGIVGIGVAIGAIMVSSHSKGWIVGLVVSIVSVVLAALLWSSRML
jgi:hypothetical protein